MTIEPVAEGVPLSDASIARPRKAVRSAKPKPKAVREPAAGLPYAQVVLASEVGHGVDVLDYLVSADLDAEAQPGVRVRVRYDGELVDGFVIGRSDESSSHGLFEWLQKVVSPLRVLTPEVIELAATVAEKYAGTLADVVRLAVPVRYANAEKQVPVDAGSRFMRWVDGAAWGPYGGGREFVSALESKTGARLPRALWTCLPGADWAVAMATAMQAVATDATTLPEPVSAAGVSAAVLPSASPVSGLDVHADLDASGDLDVDVDVDDYPVPDDYPPPDLDFDPEVYPDPDSDVVPEASSQAPPAVQQAAAPAEPIHKAGRGALAIVPNHRDLARLDRALTEVAGPGHHVVLSEELSPAKRYQNWLAVLRGDVRMVIGTRAALFAPVAELGLVAMWDDGDDRHAVPQAPYPHVREVLLLRAHQTGAGALIGGYACSAEGAQLVTSRWAFPLTAFRSTVHAKAPLIRVAGSGSAGSAGEEPATERDAGAVVARLPNLAWRVAGAGLAHGPVLIQVPQSGAAPTLACVRCRKQARCGYCHGPLGVTSGHAMPFCGWCGRPAGGWRCDGFLNDRPCGGERFRLTPAGMERTVEELGRAFEGVKVVSSTPDAMVAEVGPKSALVVAAPGAEPVAEGGYVAALLLDGWALLGRRDLRAGEEALRHWLNAAALVRAADEGGTVVVLADPGLLPVQALMRWDPAGHARRELEVRGELHHPPAARVVELTGRPAALAEELKLLRLPPDAAEVLGPVPAPVDAPGLDTPPGETQRVLIRVPRRLGVDLVARVREVQSTRGARKADDESYVRVRIDPVQM